MASETRGKIAPFARLVGVDPRTVSRWVNREVDVSEESVREVARAVKRQPMDLLVEVGYYSRADLGAGRVGGEDDPEMELILTANVDQDMKIRMIERLEELRHRDRVRLEELRERDKQRRMEDIRYILERGA